LRIHLHPAGDVTPAAAFNCATAIAAASAAIAAAAAAASGLWPVGMNKLMTWMYPLIIISLFLGPQVGLTSNMLLFCYIRFKSCGICIPWHTNKLMKWMYLLIIISLFLGPQEGHTK
jgi:uncharacterized membrane protein